VERKQLDDGIADTLVSVAVRRAEQASGRVRANSSSFDDKHCFVVDQRFVAVISKMVILLHCAIQQCIADFPSRTSVVLAQNRFK